MHKYNAYCSCFLDILGDVKQVAIVTHIDQIGVPDVDIESVFKYPNVKEYCKDVSRILEIEIQAVHPIANYHEELIPTAAKNALALKALWDIFKRGERHIHKKLEHCVDDGSRKSSFFCILIAICFQFIIALILIYKWS